MNNFDHAVEATNTAINSQGSALKENERAIDSIQGKQQALNATFEEFANNIIDNELVKNVLDLANGFLQLANTDLGQFVTQVLLLTGVGWGATSLAHAIKLLPVVGSQFSTLGTIIGMISTQGGLMNNVFAAGSLIFSNFSSVALPVIGILSALGIGVYKLYNYLKDTNPSLEEATSQLESVNEQLKLNKQRLAEVDSLGWSELTPEIIAEKEALEQENDELERQLLLLDERRIKAAKKQARTGGVVSTGQTGYVATYRGEEILGATGQGFDTYEELVRYLNDYIPEASKKTRNELESLGVEFGTVNREIYENADIYNQYLVSSMEQYVTQLKSEHQLNEEQIVDFNELKNAVAERVEGLNALKSSGEELTAEEQQLIDVYNQLNTEYNNAVSYVSNYVDSLIEQAKQTGVAEAKLYDLVKAEIMANNQKFDFSQQLSALARLASQAGATAESVAAVMALSSTDTTELIKTALQTGEAKNLREAKDLILNDLYNQMFKGVNGGGSLVSVSTGTSSKTTKKPTDKALEEFKTLQGQIKHQLEMGEIDQAAYYDALEKLVTEYKEKAIAHMTEYGLTVDKINGNMYSYEEDIYKGRLELIEKANEKQKSDMETAASYVVNKIEEEIAKLNEEKEQISKFYDDQIDALQTANDELERQIEYEEKLNALAQAKQRQVYVFKDGQFQYIQDVDEIASAQADLDAYNREQQLQDEVNRLEILKNAALEKIDATIEDWERYKEEWSGVVDQYTEEQNRLIAEQVLGIDLEQENWNTRLANAQAFADQYNAIMGSLNTGMQTTDETETKESFKTGVKLGAADFSTDYSEVASAAGKNAWAESKETGKIAITIIDGETQTADLPVGTIVHTKGGDYRITGGQSKAAGGSGYTSEKISANAMGTLSSSGGLSLVGEQGPELRVLNQGDGVIPADITRNLWDWGKVNPKSMMSTMSQIFNIDNLTLPNARDAAGLITGLKQMAYQRAYKRA